MAKSGVHIVKSNYVDVPMIEEYPLTLECTGDSFEDGELIRTVVNCSVNVVGNAFKDGLKLKD